MSLIGRMLERLGLRQPEPEIIDHLDPVPPQALSAPTHISISAAQMGLAVATEDRAMKEAASRLDKNAERIEHIQQTIAKFERRKLPVPEDLKRELGWRRALAQQLGSK